jgi:flagellum-specific peptidoglycan hydrolase FlgJ
MFDPPEDLTYGQIPPEVLGYLKMPGVNQEKALAWFNLGLSEPQTFNQAILLAQAVGYTPEQSKVVAAQWQKESGGGAHVGASYNYFGIKAHNQAVRDALTARGINVGAGEATATKEVEGGKTKSQQSSFMQFNNAFEAFAGHKAFLETNQRYQGALGAETAKDFAIGLQKAGYATDPNYGVSLYNDYVAPKERNPASGDTRPKSLGITTSSKNAPAIKMTVAEDTAPMKLPILQPQEIMQRPEFSLDPSIVPSQYGATEFEQKVVPTEAIPMNAPAGYFGGEKTVFRMGGNMYPYGGSLSSAQLLNQAVGTGKGDPVKAQQVKLNRTLNNPNAWKFEYTPAKYNYSDYIHSLGTEAAFKTRDAFPEQHNRSLAFPASIKGYADYTNNASAYNKNPQQFDLPGEYNMTGYDYHDNTATYAPHLRGIRDREIGLEGRIGMHATAGDPNQGHSFTAGLDTTAGVSNRKGFYGGIHPNLNWDWSSGNSLAKARVNTNVQLTPYDWQIQSKEPYSMLQHWAPNMTEQELAAPFSYHNDKMFYGQGKDNSIGHAVLGPKLGADVSITGRRGPLQGATLGWRGDIKFDVTNGKNVYKYPERAGGGAPGAVAIDTQNPNSTSSVNVTGFKQIPYINSSIYAAYPIAGVAGQINVAKAKVEQQKKKDAEIFGDKVDAPYVSPTAPRGVDFTPQEKPEQTGFPTGALPGYNPETGAKVGEEFTQELYNQGPKLEYGGQLGTNMTDMYNTGGGIHINPAHEGDFTAKANAAGMGVQEYAQHVLSAPEGHFDPSTRRQANFAHNAAGWHHAMGGNMYSTGGNFNNPGFNALPTNVQNKIKANSFAEGGPLTEFNAGGTHEQNPLGGIPQGTAPDGRPNLVEQGETKLDAANYIFSDNIKVDKDIVEQFNLSKTDIGRTFADVSKKLNRPNSRRETDSIENTAKERQLQSLMEAQETQKEMELQKDIQMMTEKHPQFMQSMMQQQQQSVQPMGMPQAPPPEAMGEQMPPEGMPMDPNQIPPEMLAQMEGAQQGAPVMRMGGGMYMCGGKMYNFGGSMYANGGRMYANGGNMYPYGGQPLLGGATTGSGYTSGYVPTGSSGLDNPYANNNTNALYNMMNPSGSINPLNDLTATPNPTPTIGTQGEGSGLASGLGTAAGIATTLGQGAMGVANIAQSDLNKRQKAEQYTQTGLDAGIGVANTFLPGISAVYGIQKGLGNFADKLGSSGDEAITSADGKVSAIRHGKEGAQVIGDIGSAMFNPMQSISQGVGYLADKNYKQAALSVVPFGSAINKSIDRKEDNKRANQIDRMNRGPQFSTLGMPVGDYPVTEDQMPLEHKYGGSMGAHSYRQAGTMDVKDNYDNSGKAGGNNGDPNNYLNTELTSTQRDLRSVAPFGSGIADLAPIAYNLYQGLSPYDEVAPEDLYSPMQAVRPDYTQAENQARQSYARMVNALGASGASGGQRLAGQLAGSQAMSNELMNVMTAEENAYRQSLAEANKYNAAAKSQAMMAAKDANWKMKNAKQESLKEAISGPKDKMDQMRRDAIALQYAQLGAPDISKFSQVGEIPYIQFALDNYKKKQASKAPKKSK